MAKQTVFGVGQLFAIPSGATPTPIPFGILQDVSLDESFDVKELYGSNQFPEDIGKGKGKIHITAKIGAVDPLMFNSLFYGGTMTGGETRASIMEQGTIPSTPFTITAANGATFVKDLGVYDVTTGRMLTRVASAPATGQYSVSGVGVYTYAAADTGHIVQASYTYTTAAAAGVGSTIVVNNAALGNAPAQTQLILPVSRATNGKQLVKTYNSVVCTSMKQAFKNDDFMLTDLSFTAFADSAGQVLSYSMNGTN